MPAPCQRTVSSSSAWVFRFDAESSDSTIIRELITATAKFHDDEIDIAVELVEERLIRGPVSGYEFIFVHKPAGSQPSIPDGRNQAAIEIESNGSNQSALTDPHASEVIGPQGRAPVVGFACYGKIPCTREAYDLYWIAVHPDYQGCGLGRQLLAAVEQAVRAVGGTQLYADTSGRPDYEATRRYYLATGFEQAACLTDFYAPGDDKIIFRKLV